MHQLDAGKVERQEALASLKGDEPIESPVIRTMFDAWNAEHVLDNSLYFVSPDASRYAQTGARGHLGEIPKRSKLAFLPLNVDNYHWALLVYDRTQERPKFHLYDSLGKSDRTVAAARDLARNILKELSPEVGGLDLVRHTMPPQKGNDCAVNVLGVCKMFHDRARELNAVPAPRDIAPSAFEPYLRQMSRGNLASYLSGEKPSLRSEVGGDEEMARALHRRLNGNVSARDVEAIIKAQHEPKREQGAALSELPIDARQVHQWDAKNQIWKPKIFPTSKKTLGSVFLCNEGRGGAVQSFRDGLYQHSLLYYPPCFTSEVPLETLRAFDGMEVQITHDGQGGIREMPRLTQHQQRQAQSAAAEISVRG